MMANLVARRHVQLLLPLLLVAAACADHDVTPFMPGYSELTADVARMLPELAPTRFGQEIGQAVLAHPLLSAEAARVLRAEADLRDAQAAARPQISVGLDLGASLVGSSAGGRYLPVVQVSQLLFDGGRTRARIEAARIGVVSQELARETSVAQLSLTAVEVWLELEYQGKLFEIATETLAEHEKVLALLDDRVQAGAGTQGEVQVARSRLADATARRATAQGNYERAEASFTAFFDKLPTTLPASRPAPRLPKLSDAELVATSPRIRGIDAEIGGALALLEVANSSMLPTVTGTVRGGYNPETKQLNIDATSSPSSDIFTGGKRTADRDRARAYVDDLRSERNQLEREITRSLDFLRSDMRTGRERLTAGKAAVEANEGSVAALREQYSIGRVSILQLLDAQRDLFLAREALVLAERDLVLSGYAALALTGDILDVFGTRQRIATTEDAPIHSTIIEIKPEVIESQERVALADQSSVSNLSLPFIQIGLFRDHSNAEKAKAQMERANFSAAIRTVHLNGLDFYRVVVGPANDQETRDNMLAHATQMVFLDAFGVGN